MLDITIKKADISHATKIFFIEENCFSIPWTQESIINFINDQHNIYICAFVSEELVGYIGMYDIYGEGNITNIAVLPEYRKNGIADYLIISLKKYCKNKNIHKLMLEVRMSNMPAINLYKKHEFIEVGIRKNYYTKPKEDALLMDFSFAEHMETTDENTCN